METDPSVMSRLASTGRHLRASLTRPDLHGLVVEHRADPERLLHQAPDLAMRVNEALLAWGGLASSLQQDPEYAGLSRRDCLDVLVAALGARFPESLDVKLLRAQWVYVRTILEMFSEDPQDPALRAKLRYLKWFV